MNPTPKPTKRMQTIQSQMTGNFVMSPLSWSG
jgi:hypothetical protein